MDMKVKGLPLDILQAPAVMPGYGAVPRHDWRGWPRFDHRTIAACVFYFGQISG
jgi:hypothetical protein